MRPANRTMNQSELEAKFKMSPAPMQTREKASKQVKIGFGFCISLVEKKARVLLTINSYYIPSKNYLRPLIINRSITFKQLSTHCGV